MRDPINIELTYNNQEWINALTFKYHDCKINRVAYVHNYLPDLSPEERELKWLAEEPEEDEATEDLPEEELKKRAEEKAKKI